MGRVHGGDGMLFSRLGLFYQPSDLAGYRGRWMLSPCLGLYYLLSGLCRIMGEMDAVSLSGPLLPAVRPLQENGGDVCCLLVWVYTTSFQTLLDNGGDGCCLLVWVFYYQLSDLAG